MTTPGTTRIRRGERFGIVLGVSGWTLGLAVACVAAGALDVLLTIVVPGLVVSLLLAFALLCYLDRFRQQHGVRSAHARYALIGALLIVLAVLFGLLHLWVMPTIVEHPALRDFLHATGSTTTIPWWLPVLPGAVGLGFLSAAHRQTHQADEPRPDQEPTKEIDVR